jgi:hypothetical protein
VQHTAHLKHYVGKDAQGTVKRWTKLLMANLPPLDESIIRFSNKNGDAACESNTYSCADHRTHIKQVLNRHTVSRSVYMTLPDARSDNSGYMVVCSGDSDTVQDRKTIPRQVHTTSGEVHDLPLHPGSVYRSGYKNSGGVVIDGQLCEMVCGEAEVRPSEVFLKSTLMMVETVVMYTIEGVLVGHVVYKKNDPPSYSSPPNDLASTFEKLFQEWHQVERDYKKNKTQGEMDMEYFQNNNSKKRCDQQKQPFSKDYLQYGAGGMAGQGRKTLKLPDINKNNKLYEKTGTTLFVTSMDQEKRLLGETQTFLSQLAQFLKRATPSSAQLVSLQSQLNTVLQTHTPPLQVTRRQQLQAVADAVHVLCPFLAVGQAALRRAFCDGNQCEDSTDALAATLPQFRRGVSDIHKDDVDSKSRCSIMVYNICHNKNDEIYRPEEDHTVTVDTDAIRKDMFGGTDLILFVPVQRTTGKSEGIVFLILHNNLS